MIIVSSQILYFESLNRNFEIDLGLDLEFDKKFLQGVPKKFPLGVRTKLGHFTLFFIFFSFMSKIIQICKEIVFSMGGEGTPLPESSNFLDKFGKNLVIFYNF